MQVYFSHSYRDPVINGYFLQHFEQQDIPLVLDQKTDIWCVAKLERYTREMSGFISIIPRRPTEKDAGAYSEYIAQEISLARRARLPRLLFVDERILKYHQLDFPEDAVLFSVESPEVHQERHAGSIRDFRTRLDTFHRPSPSCEPKTVAIVVGEGKGFRKVGEDLVELLRRHGYSPTVIAEKRSGRGLDDIRLLETLWSAELCVFLVGGRLSEAHIALAMAHAHCIPALRLMYDAKATECNPSSAGVIRWATGEALLVECERQLTSYREGLVSPIAMAQSSTHEDAMRRGSTMKWHSRPENLWDMQDGRALIFHIHPEHGFVSEETNRARRIFQRSLAQARTREDSERICRILYEELCRHRFGYELELKSSTAGHQVIRTPSQIETHKTATCMDMSCLFAALIEAANQKPLLAVVEGPGFAHSLVGYRAMNEPAWENVTIGTLRRAISTGDAVFFESTGAIEADAPVGAETKLERSDKLLGYGDAKDAAERMIMNSESRLRCFIDVHSVRNQSNQ